MCIYTLESVKGNYWFCVCVCACVNSYHAWYFNRMTDLNNTWQATWPLNSFNPPVNISCLSKWKYWAQHLTILMWSVGQLDTDNLVAPCHFSLPGAVGSMALFRPGWYCEKNLTVLYSYWILLIFKIVFTNRCLSLSLYSNNICIFNRDFLAVSGCYTWA